MDVIEIEDKKESIITLEDFPFICRICCLKQSDLRLFEEEDYLFDLFHTIRKIDAHSRVAFPRNICNGCVNKLEDISMFIDISKYSDVNFGNNMQPKTEIIECARDIESEMSRESVEIIEENEDHSIFQGSQICRFCSSPSSNLISFEETSHLMQVFQKITNINLKDECHFSNIITICRKCNNELEEISSFVSLSLYNDQKLENIIDTENIVKSENQFKPIDTESLFPLENNEKFEITVIRKEIIDSKLATSIKQNYHPRTSRRTLMEGPVKEGLVKESLPPNKFDIDGDLKTQNGEHFSCDYCERRFRRRWNLKKHLLIHTEKKPLKCDCCEKRFVQKSNLQRHLYLHTGIKPFRCDCCEKSFNQKNEMKRHMITHTGEKKFKCDSCEKRFYHNNLLKKHLRSHSEEKLFKCDICEKRFSQRWYLKKHLLIHTEKKTFKCDWCEKRFIRKSTLQNHLYLHTEEKLFKCESCEKSFPNKRILKTHLLNCTEKRPFKCNYCGKSFAQKTSLQRHVVVHSRENTFKCDSCNEGFNEKYQFHQHLLVHTEEKLFRCECCEKGFLLKQSLQKHYADSHKKVFSK